jgi:peptidoglycan/xylan/chitin deacetylase (PgdA/CDA1 family)
MQVTRQVLAVIKKEHLPPVYGMVNAQRMEGDPALMDTLTEWRAAGQPLASHTYSHMDLGAHTLEEWEADVLQDEPALEKLMIGQDWKWLRYPYLSEGDTPEKRAAAREWLAAMGYRVAEVSLELKDYEWNQPYARCMAKHDDVAIQRLHDTYLAAAHKHFAAYRESAKLLWGHEIPYVLLLHIGAFDGHMFPELVAQMKAEGFTFTTLQQAERDPAYATPPAQMAGGGTFQQQVAIARGLAMPGIDDYSKELEAVCR